MQSQDEIANGIGILRSYLLDSGLTLTEKRLRDRRSYLFDIVGGNKSFDFVLSEEFLMDLPATRGYRMHIEEYLPAIVSRFRNFSPRDFFAKSGKPFNLTIRWPFKEHPTRDVIWCHAEVEDLQNRGQIALTTPVVGTFLDDPDFQPLALIEAVVDAVRESLDTSAIQFYRRGEHPPETQEIRVVEKPAASRSSEAVVEEFIAEKVRWLGFKREEQSTVVWIADPWDAKYLGVSAKDLIRSAQTLRARGIVSLTPDSQVACAGNALLQGPPPSSATRSRIGFQASS